MNQFEPGDVVAFKTNETAFCPQMMVESLCQDFPLVRCAWFDIKKRLQRAEFAADLLKLVKRQQ